MSPLHSGQEDKRGRKGGIGIWERRRRRRRRAWRKKEEKVDCFLDEWGSTVLHEQENRDSFFGPWTDKSTHQSRSQDWKVKATSFVCLPLKKNNLGLLIDSRRNCSSFLFFSFCIAFQTKVFVDTQPELCIQVSYHLTQLSPPPPFPLPQKQNTCFLIILRTNQTS